MSKYPKIASLVPQGEHFDEGAILNEGGWVSTTHLAVIETALSTVPQGYVAQAELEAANAIVSTHESTITQLNGTVEAKEKEIGRLNTLVATLSKRSSGRSGSQPQAPTTDELPKDKKEGGGKTLSLSDPNHPQNIIARQNRVGQSTEK